MRRPSIDALGVDIGASRVRVCAVARVEGRPRIERVAAADVVDDDVASALGAAVRHLDLRERRCVVAVRPPEATLRSAMFPPMSAGERRRAARFAARYDDDDGDSRTRITRVRPLGRAGSFACGSVERASLLARVAACREIGLRPIAVDYEPLAWRRALPGCDAVLDVGLHASRLIVFGADVPDVSVLDFGGASFTAAVAASLGLAPERAEERKRQSGVGTAGTAERRRLTVEVFDAITALRSRGFADVRTLMLGGNGSRLAPLAPALADALGCEVVRADAAFNVACAYPADVFRAAAPDWSVAVGLALYESAA